MSIFPKLLNKEKWMNQIHKVERLMRKLVKNGVLNNLNNKCIRLLAFIKIHKYEYKIKVKVKLRKMLNNWRLIKFS